MITSEALLKKINKPVETQKPLTKFREIRNVTTSDDFRYEDFYSKYGDEHQFFLDELNEVLPRRAENMIRCGVTPIVMNDGIFNYQFTQKCNDRFCPYCSKFRAMKHNIGLRKFFNKFKNTDYAGYMRFVTLTYSNVEDLNDFDFSAISKHMAKFRRKLLDFGYEMFAGYRVLEIKHNRGTDKYKKFPFEIKGLSLDYIKYICEEHDLKYYDFASPKYQKINKKYIAVTGEYLKDTNYHPHLHMLYFADFKKSEDGRKKFSNFVKKYDVKNKNQKKIYYSTAFARRGSSKGYIDNGLLSSVWEFSNNGLGFITQPELIKHGLGAGINYVTKYITKELNDYSPKIKLDIYLHTQNLAFVQKFGSLFLPTYDIRHPPKEEWKKFTEFEKKIWRAEHLVRPAYSVRLLTKTMLVNKATYDELMFGIDINLGSCVGSEQFVERLELREDWLLKQELIKCKNNQAMSAC